jgi:hypothetical protein
MNLNFQPENVKEFWKNHVSYRFIKPINIKNLIDWIKSMFFNRSFIEAYTKTNRTIMTMRLSSFVKNKCIKIMIPLEEFYNEYTYKNENSMTILEWIDYLENLSNENHIQNITKEENINLLKIISSCDPTYSAIYSILDGIRISDSKFLKKYHIQIATKTPPKIKNFEIVNNPATLIQYIYNREDFLIDNRYTSSIYTLEKDYNIVRERLNDDLFQTDNSMGVLSVFNDISISKEKPIVMMGYDRNSKQLFDVIKDILENNLFLHKRCEVVINKLITVTDPFTGKTVYTRGIKTTPDLYQQSIENLTIIYSYLTMKTDYTETEKRLLLEKLLFKINDEKKEIYNCRDILSVYNKSYVKQYEISRDILKMVSYLKAVLYGDIDLINYMTENLYHFTYRYEKESFFDNNKEKGEIICYFTQNKSTVKLIKNDKTISPIIFFKNTRMKFMPIN